MPPPGTQVEFVDEGGVIRLLVRRRVPVSDPVTGFGVLRTANGRLEFDWVMRGFYEAEPASFCDAIAHLL